LAAEIPRAGGTHGRGTGEARLQALQCIKRAAKHDWRAAVAWLRLSFPTDYRRTSNTSVEVNTAVQAQGIVLTEEQRQALIALRERILEEAAAKLATQFRRCRGNEEFRAQSWNSDVGGDFEQRFGSLRIRHDYRIVA
jgi:hypothetical protein